MAEHGGYRPPIKPSPVAMPGAMSGRTDGGPADTQPTRIAPGNGYGEAKNLADIQGGASMAGNPVPTVTPEPIPLGADSQRPSEPVTAGAPFGPGIGPQAAGIDTRDLNKQDADRWRSQLPLLEFLASQDDASPTTRALVRRLRGNL